MKKGRDVKFIIYQVLYIFVVCVISIKGADISLEEVINKDVVVEKSFADSLKSFIDSLLALGLVPEIHVDTNKKYTAEDMSKLLAELNQLKVTVQQNPIIRQPDIMKPKEQEPKKDEKQEIKANVQGVELTQYTSTTIRNPYNDNLEILADGKLLANIAPKASAKITIMGESSVTFKVGSASDTKRTKENQVPQISITRVGSGGEDASLRSVQNSVGFRVGIIDDFPQNLDVNFSGPVTTKQVGPTTFDVTLNLLGSQQAFDSWTKGKDSPYRVSFTVHVKDRLNPKHDLRQAGTFIFGKL